LGQKEKKNKEEEKMGMGERKRKEEQGDKKNTKGACVILKMKRREKFCSKLLLFVQI
jgi:hypothetical protein